MLRFLLPLISLFMIIGCAVEEESACSSESSIVVTSAWEIDNTTSINIEGQVGVPLTATPVLTGVPTSCAGKGSFSYNVGQLPAGLSFNEASGVISGTPTQAISIGATGLVTLNLPGYPSVQILNNITIRN